MMKYTRVYVSNVGTREFLIVEWEKDEHGTTRGISIPIDTIRKFDLDASNGCGNAVQILTDDPDQEYYFSEDGADLIREFIRQNERG